MRVMIAPRLLRHVLTAALALLVSAPVGFGAQLHQSATGERPEKAISIAILQGEGVAHSVKLRTPTHLVVEVRNEYGLPLVGAEVVFVAPAIGPGGVFEGGQTKVTTKSANNGQAAAMGFVPNTEIGRFNIKVTATLRGLTANMVISQRNVEKVPKVDADSGGGWWKIVAIAGAGAAVAGVLAATGGGSDGSSGSPSSGPPPVVTIVPGTVTVAPPR